MIGYKSHNRWAVYATSFVYKSYIDYKRVLAISSIIAESNSMRYERLAKWQSNIQPKTFFSREGYAIAFAGHKQHKSRIWKKYHRHAFMKCKFVSLSPISLTLTLSLDKFVTLSPTSNLIHHPKVVGVVLFELTNKDYRMVCNKERNTQN
jgi:hypothetical protein